MKSTLLLIALTLLAIPTSSTQSSNGLAQSTFRSYELYSWPQSKGIWNFCMLPSPSGVNISIESIFDTKVRLSGVGQLKGKISELPSGTTIYWMAGTTSGETPTPESRKLALPPPKTFTQVKRFAAARGVQIFVLSPNPD
jgi:hypothetical protein